MNGQTVDRVARALARGMPRRAVLKSVAAAVGGGVLVPLTGDESAARNRCCRRERRRAKRFCVAVGGENCNHITGFSCTKTGPGTCSNSGWTCTTKDGGSCV